MRRCSQRMFLGPHYGEGAEGVGLLKIFYVGGSASGTLPYTVEPRTTDTRFIRTPRYYGKFVCPVQNLKNILNNKP